MTSYVCVCFYILECVYIPYFSYTEVVFKNLSDREWAGIVLSV